MANKITEIKERVLQIAKYHGVSYEKFSNEIGMSYASFKGKAKFTPLNSDAIANIITIYPDVDCYWLLTGNGQMLKKVGTMAREEIEVLLGKKVYLELFVKVIENWRQKPNLFEELGISEEDD